MESKYFTRHFSSDLIQSNIPQSKNNLLNGLQFITVAPGIQKRGCPRTTTGPSLPPLHPTLWIPGNFSQHWDSRLPPQTLLITPHPLHLALHLAP